MGLRYLWDTNSVIYFLQSNFPENGQELMRNIINSYTPAISVITEIELLSWKAGYEQNVAILNSFITDCQIFELEKKIKTETISIRRDYSLKLPDAIIAATAISMNLTLISNDKRGFNKIPSLKLFNPSQLI